MGGLGSGSYKKGQVIRGGSSQPGYPNICVKNYPGIHPRGYIFECLYLYEGTFGPVPINKILHHKNQVKMDSRPSNMKEITNEQNMKLTRKSPRIRKLNPQPWVYAGSLKKRQQKYSWLKDDERIFAGYVVVYRPKHPRSSRLKSYFGYIKRAIINWETANKKSVPSGWVVHHIDDNKLNDDPLNLETKPHAAHIRHITIKELNKLRQDKRIYWKNCDRILYQELLRKAKIRGRRIDQMLKQGMSPKTIDKVERKKFLEAR